MPDKQALECKSRNYNDCIKPGNTGRVSLSQQWQMDCLLLPFFIEFLPPLRLHVAFTRIDHRLIVEGRIR